MKMFMRKYDKAIPTKFWSFLICDRYFTAWDNLDIDEDLACVHEDYDITFHTTGRVMRLKELSSQTGSMRVLAKFDNRRLIYDNEDILVTHGITKFGDGHRKAVLQSTLKKDGLLRRAETGTTPFLSKD